MIVLNRTIVTVWMSLAVSLTAHGQRAASGWLVADGIKRFSANGTLGDLPSQMGGIVVPLELPFEKDGDNATRLAHATTYETETLPKLLAWSEAHHLSVSLYVRVLEPGLLCKKELPDDVYEAYSTAPNQANTVWHRFLSPSRVKERLNFIKKRIGALNRPAGSQVVLDVLQPGNLFFSLSTATRSEMVQTIGIDPIDFPYKDSTQLTNGFGKERPENRLAFTNIVLFRQKQVDACLANLKTELNDYTLSVYDLSTGVFLSPIQRLNSGYALSPLLDRSGVSNVTLYVRSLAEADTLVGNPPAWLLNQKHIEFVCGDAATLAALAPLATKQVLLTLVIR